MAIVAGCASGTVGRAGWTPAEDDRNVRWARRPAGREYVNQIGLETNEGSERIKAACGPNHERLVALNNIKPTVYGIVS